MIKSHIHFKWFDLTTCIHTHQVIVWWGDGHKIKKLQTREKSGQDVRVLTTTIPGGQEDLGIFQGEGHLSWGFMGSQGSPDGEEEKVSCFLYFLMAFALSPGPTGRTPLKFQFLGFFFLICDACGGGFWGKT